jgi:hypothetical protein
MISRVTLLACLALATSSCAPGECGKVSIKGVEMNADIEKFRNADGTIGLYELCGTEYGVFASNRGDLKITTLLLDANVRDTELSDDLRINGVILPAGSIAFWDAHLVPGTTLTTAQLAGSGLHKQSESAIYQTYALSSGTLTVVEGPRNRKVDDFGDHEWTEEWHLKWDLEFGNGMQRWTGDDWVEHSSGTEIGTPAFTPPDPMP